MPNLRQHSRKVRYIEIEVVCTNEVEHRTRVENRSPDIKGHKLPRWNDVVRREYEVWEEDHIVIDTAGQTLEQSIASLSQRLKIKVNK